MGSCRGCGAPDDQGCRRGCSETASAPPEMPQPPKCEGDCNPHCASCGAKFCTYEAMAEHQRECRAAGAPETPAPPASDYEAMKSSNPQLLHLAEEHVAEMEALTVKHDAELAVLRSALAAEKLWNALRISKVKADLHAELQQAAERIALQKRVDEQSKLLNHDVLYALRNAALDWHDRNHDNDGPWEDDCRKHHICRVLSDYSELLNGQR